MNYEIIESENEISGKSVIIKRTNDDGSITFIPSIESNSDYQRYLRHLSGEDEGGTLS